MQASNSLSLFCVHRDIHSDYVLTLHMRHLRRLDAIGAVGIARCFTFGGRFNRMLHDPSVPPRTVLTKEAYMAGAAQVG